MLDGGDFPEFVVYVCTAHLITIVKKLMLSCRFLIIYILLYYMKPVWCYVTDVVLNDTLSTYTRKSESFPSCIVCWSQVNNATQHSMLTQRKIVCSTRLVWWVVRWTISHCEGWMLQAVDCQQEQLTINWLNFNNWTKIQFQCCIVDKLYMSDGHVMNKSNTPNTIYTLPDGLFLIFGLTILII